MKKKQNERRKSLKLLKTFSKQVANKAKKQMKNKKKGPKMTEEEKKARREVKKLETQMKNMINSEKKRRVKFAEKFNAKFGTDVDMNKY